MAITYEKITSATLASSGQFSITNIPQTFDDLILILSTRGNNPDNLNINFYINGSNSAVYNYTNLIGEGGNTFSQRQTNYVIWEGYAITNGSGNTANSFSTVEMYFPNYASTSVSKICGVLGLKVSNSSSANAYVLNQTATNINNNAAITQIDLGPGNGSFVSGSSFYLYGIKNT